jgi:tRNA threonylcarbamoyladenosine biosynthesis protein TsaB
MPDNDPDNKFLLSLSTSEKVASVCVSCREEVAISVEFEQWSKQFSSSEPPAKSTSLIPIIQEAMDQSGTDETQLEAIALTNGPGRFTGLRVGVVTARMLCYAWHVPVLVVNSLEVVAEKLRRERELSVGSKIWSITDAQRRQVFAAQFEVTEDNGLVQCEPQTLFERNAILELIQSGEHVTGSGAVSFRESLESATGIELPDAAVANCDAAGVAQLSQDRLARRDFDDLLKIEPIYFRPSAAEEVRMAKEASP